MSIAICTCVMYWGPSCIPQGVECVVPVGRSLDGRIQQAQLAEDTAEHVTGGLQGREQ